MFIQIMNLFSTKNFFSHSINHQSNSKNERLEAYRKNSKIIFKLLFMFSFSLLCMNAASSVHQNTSRLSYKKILQQFESETSTCKTGRTDSLVAELRLKRQTDV